MRGNVAASKGPDGSRRRLSVKGTDSRGTNALLSTTKVDTIILGDIQRHLLSQPKDVGRQMDVLHVSDLCKDDACALALYHRLIGTPVVKEEFVSYNILNIWQEGTEIGERWAQRVDALGRLWGRWVCLACKHKWMGKSQKTCWKCDSPFIRYDEVPLVSEKHKLAGHGDVQLDGPSGPIGEVKSIGVGTLRFDNPDLLDKYTYTFEHEGKPKKITDLAAVWDNVKRPFPPHLKQAHTYGFMANAMGHEVERIFFIYECKWNQQMKEFSIKYNEKYAEPVLELALDINYAVSKLKPPGCSNKGKKCRYCSIYEPGAQDEGKSGRDGEAGGRVQSREGAAGERGAVPSSKAAVPSTDCADEGDGRERRHPDEPVRSSDSVRRLRRRTVSRVGDRGTLRRNGS